MQLVDRTSTRVGREALGRLLRSPAHDAEVIVANQQAQRVLASDAGRCQAIVSQSELEGLVRYLGTATAEYGWIYPVPSDHFSVQGLRHPFLGSQAVPNDLELDSRVRVCFLTGPNMAGKSTLLRAIGVAMLLAHAGCGVPASSMAFPVVGAIFSSVSVSDSLHAGESFYLAEIRRLKLLAEALRDHGSAFAVLDEPLRGTNVHDATDATLAVMIRLAEQPSSLVFVASHISEVGVAVADDARIRLLHVAATIAGDQIQYDYVLREGLSAQRLGMTLLRQERVLELLESAASVP